MSKVIIWNLRIRIWLFTPKRLYLCIVKNLSVRSIILGGGIAVFVPLICFLILRGAGHDGHVAVPKNYGIDTVITKTVDGETVIDTLYHTMGETNFLSHLNKRVDLSTDYPRETLVLNFFTTGDNANSDKLAYHMKRIQAGFKLKKHDTSIQLISIASNPEIDSLEALRNYANEHTLDHDTWTFLTGAKEEIMRVVANDLFLPQLSSLEKNSVPTDIILIDKYRNIRGYYDGLDSMEIKRCIDDVALLMVEKNKIHEKKSRR